MNRLFLLSLLFLALCQWGSSHPQKQAVSKPEALVEEWFGRLNNLDDWWISMDGKEENAAVVDRFLELFGPDAYLQVGPSKNQLGKVVYHGRDAIRKWADEFSRTYLDLNYRTQFKTRGEQTTKPIYIFQTPWGDTGVAVEFTGVYTMRHDRRRFWIPGAAFFQFDKDGKIQDLRLYMLRDEAEETKPYLAM
jgi:hypothetical protein